jgi:hypothetical protein
MEEMVTPFPRPETTPPVTTMYFMFDGAGVVQIVRGRTLEVFPNCERLVIFCGCRLSVFWRESPSLQVVPPQTIAMPPLHFMSVPLSVFRRVSVASNSGQRSFRSSAKLYQAKRQKDLFTPSPFARRDKLNISDEYAVQRELREGDDAYGVRRYLLLPRTDGDESTKPTPIASLNANKHILFGATLHINPNSSDVPKFQSALGPLLDVAKEDASVNGQQPQALATLNGMCSWVKQCLDEDGEGSDVITKLIHGGQPNLLHDNTNNGVEEVTSTSNTNTSEEKIKRMSNQRIKDQSAKLILNKEADRILLLDAVRAIATGVPRPGHSVVGAGTYRDGKDAWIALAWEYCQLASNRKGLEEVQLYRSRDGEVTTIEHLAHTEPEYLKEAGGAMARMFFV